MNYLRQMVLCRGDMHTEPFILDRAGEPKADVRGTHRCRDFMAVYVAIEDSQKGYSEYLTERENDRTADGVYT